MAENNKKPKIRFKGFTEAWEQRKLGDFCEMFNGDRGINYPKDSDMVQAGIPFVNAGDLQEGKVNLATANKITREKFDQLGGAKIKRGDILYCLRGTLGKNAFVDNFDEGTVASSLVDIRPKNVDSQYLFTVLNSDIEYRQRILCDEGAAQPNLSARNLANFDIPVPKIEEQVKIGRHFESLSNLITLHQRKCDKLVNVKKALLEKMFPNNGKNVPELRFSGFNEAWEQRKLLDCIQKITDFRGRTPKKLGMDWSEEGYLALSALNVKDGYIDFNQDVHYGNQELYDKWMTGNELHKGQVLFTTEAPMGNVAQVPDNRRYILSQRTIAFDVKDNLLTENFLATVLRTPTVFAYLTALSSGGTAKGVSQKSLSSVEIRLPKDLKEQEIIADTFSNLDHLITLHQRKLESLKKIKKSLLEKMFI